MGIFDGLGLHIVSYPFAVLFLFLGSSLQWGVWSAGFYTGQKSQAIHLSWFIPVAERRSHTSKLDARCKRLDHTSTLSTIDL